MPKITYILVEDEELPRLSLKAKLATYHPEMEILDACEEAESALESILRHKPQILFLDIQLPGKDSLWLLEQLQQTGMKLPQLIFTTAFTDSRYLLKAIKFSAVDYLNKPVGIVELAQAVEKAKKRIREELSQEQQAVEKKYTFSTFNSILVVGCDEIVFFRADGNYARLILLHGKSELVFERLGEIEEKLDKGLFFRAGRSLILNRKYIHKINVKDSSCTMLAGEYSCNLPVSRTFIARLKELNL